MYYEHVLHCYPNFSFSVCIQVLENVVGIIFFLLISQIAVYYDCLSIRLGEGLLAFYFIMTFSFDMTLFCDCSTDLCAYQFLFISHTHLVFHIILLSFVMIICGMLPI